MRLICSLILFMLFTAQSEAKPYSVEDFFKFAKYKNIKISPDGNYIAANYEEGNQVNLVVIDLGSKKVLGTFEFGNFRQVQNFHWVNSERVIMEVAEVKGYLDRRSKPSYIYAGNIDARQRKWLIPKSSLFGFRILDLLKDDPNNILVLKFYRDGAKLHKLNVYTGESDYLGGPNETLYSLAVDHNQKVRFGSKVNNKDEQEIHILHDDGVWQKVSLPGSTIRPSLSPIGFSLDNELFYFSSNHDHSLKGLFKYDLGSGEAELVYRHKYVDLGRPIFSTENELLGVSLMPDYPAIYWVKTDHPEVKLRKTLSKTFPGHNVSATSFTADGSKAIVHVRSDVNPGVFYIYDTVKQEMKYLTEVMPWINPEDMSSMQAIRIRSRDGVSLSGYLTLPNGSDGKDLPLIMHPHGGPHGPRETWGYNSEVQFYANRGFAVLQLDFRGSGGYGADFERAGHKKWGTLMQDDLTDAVNWAVEQGMADPGRLCIAGGSYGGYAALMSVIREPDLYQCAFGYVGVYDLDVMRKAGDIPKSRSGRRFLKRVLPTSKADLAAQSPAKNVDKIKAALFLAHGKRDQRVPMAQGNSLRKALDKANKPYIWMAKDEGHGYTKMENRIELYSKLENFFNLHIGQ